MLGILKPNLKILAVSAGAIVIILISAFFLYPKKPEPVVWKGIYLEDRYGFTCVINAWQGKDDTIVKCFCSAQEAIWAFKSLKKDVKVIDGILNGRKDGESQSKR